MLIRRAIVADRFYPADPQILREEVETFFKVGPKYFSILEEKDVKPFVVMLPHAGYVYCGKVLGGTLSSCILPKRLIILCPNHTGQGKQLSVWPSGAWLSPLLPVTVDDYLAKRILDCNGGFEASTIAHLGEHSIEVLLPFLQVLLGEDNFSIVPICIGTQNLDILKTAGQALGKLILDMKSGGNDIGIIVSSDMNHYESEDVTIEKDNLALERILACDPEGLLSVMHNEHITMCGASPMALALITAKICGNVNASIIAHETSATVSHDTEHVVGYAGVRLFLN